LAIIIISKLDKHATDQNTLGLEKLPKTSKVVWASWIVLIIVMISLYLFFN